MMNKSSSSTIGTENNTKTVLVTGASRGIGRSIALRLGKEGYDVVVHCRNSLQQAEETCQEILSFNQSSRILQFDIADRATAKQQLEADIERHGSYYGVVCNAGLSKDGAFPALTNQDWDSVIHTNLDGFYNVLHPLIMPLVRRRSPGRAAREFGIAAAVRCAVWRQQHGFDRCGAPRGYRIRAH